MKQISLLKKQKSAYGGELLKKRKGRLSGRPLTTKETMHLVLRSTKAKGEWSFKRPKNEHKIQQIIHKFSIRYGVKIISMANVGNHLHFQIKLSHRYTYKPFIRAITSAIMMAVTNASRWHKKLASQSQKFWDNRPYTRFVQSFKAYLNLKDYIKINQLEGMGIDRDFARLLIKSRAVNTS